LNENNCLNNNTVNTDSVDEFPNDDNLLSEIDLQNLSEVSEVIERYESANTKQQSAIYVYCHISTILYVIVTFPIEAF
jgi:hypothetical protein